MFFVAAQYVTKTLITGSSNSSVAPRNDAGDLSVSDKSSGYTRAAIPQQISPVWPSGTKLDVSVYVSPSWVIRSLSSMPAEWLVLEEKEFRLGDWDEHRRIHTTIPLPQNVQRNGTLWAHFFVGQSGSTLDPMLPEYDSAKAYHFLKPLSQHLSKKKAIKTRSLLGVFSDKNETEATEQPIDTEASSMVSYYHPNITFSFVPDAGVITWPTYHPALRQYVRLESSDARDSSGQNGWYYPILYPNTFWQLKDHMMELNETVETVSLNMELSNVQHWKFSMFASIDEGMKQTARKAASGQMAPNGDGSEFEEFKRIILESNTYLLATTGVVTLLHTVFEMLAFKNDVSHWRNKKDNVGTSFRTILANVVMQVIIFLYLLDNNENTSWMILLGQGVGILIEAWKITRTVNVRLRPTPAGSLIPYTVKFEDKHQLSETEKRTQEYDQIAFKYLYRVAIPLLLAYAAYSLMYETHKSWYSFTITTLVGSVYAYGFLMMVPSLYINYRLKSVAHVPGKAMMYKFLNTFIDDLFAFTIKMPMLHRLATLRDDVIFFIYLYQSWKYKTDYSRVNEFGQGGGEDDNENKKSEKPLSASPNGETMDLNNENKLSNGSRVNGISTGANVGKEDMAGKRRR